MSVADTSASNNSSSVGSAFTAVPTAQGLYDPRLERDACGVAVVATMRGWAGHDIVEHALTALRNLEHRGATGADPSVGDGVGILTQIPDEFFRAVCDFHLPAAGQYAVGIAFLPSSPDEQWHIGERFAQLAGEEGLRVLGWREMPINPDGVGQAAVDVIPVFRQVFVADAEGNAAGIELDRMAFCLRKRIEHETRVYFPSLSARTIVYKGMLTTGQLEPFFPDLSDKRFTTQLALVHQRFSTNTFPSWKLAHPYRLIAHNGEINTVRGNQNWMRARESMIASNLFRGDLSRTFPICTPDNSDSASFDEVLEMMHLGGRSLPGSVLMMIPEAWENHACMDPARKAFYEYNSTIMEPWDGPACVTFTDGTLIGAVLDRNGLRPGRYSVTDDGLVVLASEAGVLDLDPVRVVRKGRLRPGRMFLLDTAAGRIVSDEEVKQQLAAEHPYGEWLTAGIIKLADLAEREHIWHTAASVERRQQTLGYTHEELRIILAPMARTGGEALGSMGTDTPIAVLSQRPRLIFDYFTQLFAQVTNPPLDAIREELVTSLFTLMGPESNALEIGPQHARQVELPFPVIDNDELSKLVHINAEGNFPGYGTYVIRGTYNVEGGETALRARLQGIFAEVSQAIADGYRFVVLSDRDSNSEFAPIPSLLLTAAVHHHLVREKTRTQVGLLVEAGDVREVHHIALLVGYGAAAVNPYLAMESVEDLVRRGELPDITTEQATKNLIKALGKGLLKVMSKMGISTVASYRGAQVFEAIGLSDKLIDDYFTGTFSRLGGVGLDVIAAEVAARHATAYPKSGQRPPHRTLETGGEYQWRRDGEPHLFDPETVFRLQHSTRSRRYDIFKQYTKRVDEQSTRLMTLRGLFRFDSGRPSIPIEDVESVADIVTRFSTGAMSYGSISKEAHETLAVAMNRLGARSNTGEGGEDLDRLLDPERRSSIKQVASGRFGVTSVYLTQADDIQIKMAQGAKPGEGGQLPGPKVYPWIAGTRNSTPGVGLISPPPHHDIYSIEDLAQLIHDLKNANPAARIHVKLVAEVGVGTVAAGVSKAHADVVLISGHDGGTGAAPMTSLKHAGGPWELGLAETQQTLLLNDLRDRIVVQTDGQLKTGRDVMVAALLGAEEFGFASAPLVVSGCIMMRVCHLDTCPVGVATQNPELRARFSGKPEFVETFFEYIAEEVRELLAELGFATIQEAVGQVGALDTRDAVDHWKAQGLNLAPILADVDVAPGSPRCHTIAQEHGLEKALDQQLIALSQDALQDQAPVRIELPVSNVNRTVGTMLGHEVTKRYPEGLADGTIDISLTGTAGQSLGAFLPSGISLRVFGEGNDYVAKGLSGGRVVVRPLREAAFVPELNAIAGNVIAYGATSGEVFLRGQVGERFCVRNSGAAAVVEGVGDHGCEYMTGGIVLVLGPTGRNFGAGMSGGVAFVLDLEESNVNTDLVDVLPIRDGDLDRVHTLLRDHHEWTESQVAAKVLTAWPESATRLSLVLPRNYQRVLDVRAQADEEGLDPDGAQVWERIMEVNRG